MSKQFMDKLISDTKNGEWDNGFSVNAAGNLFTFTAPKQILTKANFSLDKNKKGKEIGSGVFVFPNGYGIWFENLSELKDAVLESLQRTVVDQMAEYDGPVETETQDTSISDQTTLPKPSKPDQPNKVKQKGEAK
jgi:hypothetical protein